MLTFIHGYKGRSCPGCGQVGPPLDDETFDRYFRGETQACASCSLDESAWNLLRRGIRSESPFLPGVVGLGVAHTAFGKIVIRRGTATTVDLSEMGVPPDAAVLFLNFTPLFEEGGDFLRPAITQQNMRRRAVPHIMHVVGIGEVEASDVNVMCVWLDPDVGPELEPLINAVEAYSNDEYRQVVLPASVAVEDKLHSVLVNHYLGFGSARNVESFLKVASFGHQLKFLLPSLMEHLGAPPLPSEVQDQLRALKTLRDRVAHRHIAVSRLDAGDALLGALFGFTYLRLYGPPETTGQEL